MPGKMQVSSRTPWLKRGSGVSEKDIVDCEDQFQIKKRSIQWSPSSFTVLTVEARPWCAMGMPPTANRSIAVMPVGAAVARTRLPMPIQKLVARRLCTPTKNAAACVASPARLGSLGQPCPVGSKKRSSASSLMDHSGGPRPRGCHFHHAGTR